MSLIRPFAGLRPAPSRAAEVAAPPYDVLSTEEARVRCAGKPWSFLHISKPEIDLPVGTDPYVAEVYAKAAENLDKMLAAGVLVRDDAPCYYAYRLTMGEHSQTGLVAAASVADYDTNRIRKHEFTRPDKEDDRVRQIDALNAQTGPVLLAYPPAQQVDAILIKASSGTPDADVTAEDGIRHTIWVIRDAAVLSQLTAAFDAMPALYIADGHHRSAAASRVAAARRAANTKHSGEESYNYFLSVIFPHHQMKIMDYNRVMTDLNGMDAAGFLKRIAENFSVQPSATAVKPSKPGEFGLYLPGQWYRLNIRADLIPANDPVARLDVSLLQNHLIAPVLGINDPRRDKRIDFVGGIRGLPELEKRVNSDGMAVAFALFATRMEDLMAVADANEVMPPKSTWFEPKLADGLVSHVLD
ncbi:MAG: DUF1015 domain-containing protein [Gammaproteobacteria bacterium]|nr:DUF1015 domain-containing protein [Gammaproteobacteria bacterium]MBU1776830.1 DUF1015 domain-containing protein [Gammaproteobacteria bacterium]MBU1969755.1 DUF1015 domain-containing protein [Gammaproteobacteria bacterium]